MLTKAQILDTATGRAFVAHCASLRSERQEAWLAELHLMWKTKR